MSYRTKLIYDKGIHVYTHHSPTTSFKCLSSTWINSISTIYISGLHLIQTSLVYGNKTTCQVSDGQSSNQLIHLSQQKLKRFSSGSLSPISSSPAPCPQSDTVLHLHCKQTQSSCWECAISRKSCKAQGWERTCSRPSVTNCLVIPVIQTPGQPRFLGNQRLIDPVQKAGDTLALASRPA